MAFPRFATLSDKFRSPTEIETAAEKKAREAREAQQELARFRRAQDTQEENRARARATKLDNAVRPTLNNLQELESRASNAQFQNMRETTRAQFQQIDARTAREETLREATAPALAEVRKRALELRDVERSSSIPNAEELSLRPTPPNAGLQGVEQQNQPPSASDIRKRSGLLSSALEEEVPGIFGVQQSAFQSEGVPSPNQVVPDVNQALALMRRLDGGEFGDPRSRENAGLKQYLQSIIDNSALGQGIAKSQAPGRFTPGGFTDIVGEHLGAGLQKSLGDLPPSTLDNLELIERNVYEPGIGVPGQNIVRAGPTAPFEAASRGFGSPGSTKFFENYADIVSEAATEVPSDVNAGLDFFATGDRELLEAQKEKTPAGFRYAAEFAFDPLNFFGIGVLDDMFRLVARAKAGSAEAIGKLSRFVGPGQLDRLSTDDIIETAGRALKNNGVDPKAGGSLDDILTANQGTGVSPGAIEPSRAARIADEGAATAGAGGIAPAPRPLGATSSFATEAQFPTEGGFDTARQIDTPATAFGDEAVQERALFPDQPRSQPITSPAVEPRGIPALAGGTGADRALTDEALGEGVNNIAQFISPSIDEATDLTRGCVLLKRFDRGRNLIKDEGDRFCLEIRL